MAVLDPNLAVNLFLPNLEIIWIPCIANLGIMWDVIFFYKIEQCICLGKLRRVHSFVMEPRKCFKHLSYSKVGRCLVLLI